MDDITRLALWMKDNENPSPYSPIMGTVISLPNLRIQVGTKAILDSKEVKTTFDIYKKVTHNSGVAEYAYLNKTVVLLPYSKDQKFIAIGVLQE
ncbi:MAG: DUF2577 family protein [Clostridia bacterium]|nr:DUF2577 family protein [Clostridia bacterium]